MDPVSSPGRASPPLGSFTGRLKEELADPTLLVLPVVAGAFCLLRWLDLIAPEPYWLYITIIMAAGVIRLGHSALWSASARPWQRNANIATSMAVIAVVAYSTGWGPILSIGFIFGAATGLQMYGSSATWPCLILTATFIVFGQIAIITHRAPTLIHQPTVEGVAALGLLGALVVIEMLGRATADQEQLSDQLRRSERRFSALVTRSSDIVLIVEPDGSIIYASPAFEVVLGYPVAEAESVSGAALVHPDDLPRLRGSLETAGSAGSTAFQEFRLRRNDGEYLWFEAALTNLTADPDVAGIVANMRDITRRKNAEDRLAYAAEHDALTGLPNRTLIHRRMERLQEQASRQPALTAVLFIDLDNFKDINDTLGHEVGDQLLAGVGARLSQAVRDGDTVGRLGGDEFVVLVHDAARVSAESVAERIHWLLDTPFEVPGSDVALQVTASIGIAEGALARADLLRDADIALYEAKATGKHCSVTFAPSMQEAITRHRAMDVDLQRALEDEQFFLQYQPTVDLSSGRFIGVEALLRWRHPDRGVIQPNDFIPALERTRLIVPVGEWVLRQACEQGERWRRKGLIQTISVNVSAIQLERDRVIDDVNRALAASGLEPHRLIVEVTETALMNDVEATLTRLTLLKSLGVRLAIDDFGTGYSSLAYLRQLPIDVLKIDQSFVSGMLESRESTAIVHTLVQLGKVLGLTTVAEGIEHVEQRDQLQREGVDIGQGYLFSRPLDAAVIETFWERAAADREPVTSAGSPMLGTS